MDLSTLAGPAALPRVRQAEAIALDGVRLAVVLIEDPDPLIVVDMPERRIEGVDDAWARDGSSRGEGIVLMRDGHVLVVKEKPPGEEWAAPDTERLATLVWWPGDDAFDDFSDAAVDSDGLLYLLSDRSSAIGRVSRPLEAGCGLPANLDRVWHLPGVVDKAEGWPSCRTVPRSSRWTT